MRSHRLVLALGLIMCVAVSSCGSSAKLATGENATAAGSVGVGTTGPIGVASASASQSGSTGGSGGSVGTSGAGSSSGGSNGGGSGSGSSSPLQVTVDVAPIGDLAITQCPHTYTINGVVSVNKGPVALTYGWKIDGVAPAHERTVQFTGHGSQSGNVSLDYSISGFMRTTTIELVVIGHNAKPAPTASTTFELICGATVQPVSVDPATGTCPFNAKYSTNIYVPASQTVYYQWVFSDGTSSQTQSVQLTDPANPVDGTVQTSIFTFHQVTTGVPGGVAARVEITSAGGFKTAFSAAATCN
jgi:hypothetical protein